MTEMTPASNTTVDICEHENGTWDFHIIAAENGNVLCYSAQGYVDRSECERIAQRVVSAAVLGVTFTITRKDTG